MLPEERRAGNRYRTGTVLSRRKRPVSRTDSPAPNCYTIAVLDIGRRGECGAFRRYSRDSHSAAR
jgi:hypothetical protein